MSQTIDHRVVEMKFDNKQFETGVATTMSTLQKLKKSLDFSKIGNTFENINRASNKVDLGGIDRAISDVHTKFSALEVMAITTLGNITNSFVNSAKRWASAFTIDPIKSGFQEYETQINAVQTILANTQKEGTNIKQVNAALDELNTYADKTIYNFTEMTRNIGTFTAAGVDLKTSVSAIQGIANLAAVSGSNSQQASVAMYQLSQALATGTIRLMDWNSVVNAGMGGQIFQDALIETSRLLGTGADAAIKAEGSFRDSLQAGWLTSEVLTETLKKFTTSGAVEYISNYTGLSKEAIEGELELAESIYGEADAIDKAAESLAKKSGKNKDEIAETLRFAKTAEDAATKVKTLSQLIDTLKEAIQSGWAQSFRIIVGDFEEAKELFTEISDSFSAVISASADARNELLSEVFEKRNGRELLIDSLKNSLNGLLSVVKPVKEAFREVFPPATAEQVYGVLKAFHEFTEALVLSEKNSKNLKAAFKGIFDVIKLLGDGFISLVNIVLPIKEPISSLGDNLLEVSANVGMAMSKFSNWVREAPSISKAYNIVEIGVETLSKMLDSFIESAGKFISSVKDFPIVQKAIEGIKDAIDSLGDVSGEFEISFNPFKDALNLFLGIVKMSGPIVTTIIKGIGDAISSLFKGISKALDSGGFDNIYDLLNTAVLVGIGKQLSTFIKNLNNTVNSAGGFISNIKGIISGVTDSFDELQNTLKAVTLKEIAFSLALITGSIFVLSTIDPEKLTGSLAAVTVLLGELTGVFVILNTIDKNKKSALKGLTSLLSMSASILILSSALKKISDIDSNKLIGSLTAISILLAEMATISVVLSKYGGKMKTGVTGIIAFSSAIYIISSAVQKLGELNVDTLVKGLVSVGSLLTEISLFMASSKFGEFKASQAVGIVVLSGALLILQKAVEKFGSLDVGSLLSGIIAIGAILAEISAFSSVTGRSENILSTAISLVIIAKALEMLKDPIGVFGNMDLSQIGKGLIAMGIALTEIAIAMKMMPKDSLSISVGLIAVAGSLMVISDVVLKMSGMSWTEIAKGMAVLAGSMTILAISMNSMSGTLGASASMLVLSAALAILSPTLKTFGSMSLSEIAKGLIVLAGAFTIIGVAGGLLSPVIPAILGLSAAMALIGIAASTAGIGILALSAGLTSLAASGVAGAAALVEVSKILIVGFLNTISDSAEALARTLKTLILVGCDVLVECVPTIVKTALVVVKEVLTSLASNAPEIVSQLLKLIIGIIDALAENLPTIIQSVVNLFMQFFSGLVTTLEGIDTKTLLEGIVALGLISGIMLALSAMAGLAPSAMVGVLAMGAVIVELGLLLAAIGALAQIPGLNWLIGEGGQLLQGVGMAIGKFVGGIVAGGISAIASQLPQIGTDLSMFMMNLQPFIIGSKNIDAGALASVGFLAAIIIALTAAEVINGIASLFGLSLVDMAIELSSFMVALQPFILYSKQLKEDSMKACGYLADMIIKITAAQLVAGISRFLGISGSLTSFGEELSKFGPYIKEFSEQVKGITPESVQGAAAAAEIMANVANKLPGTDGLAQKIFGERSLSEFGNELILFGPAIKMFSLQVTGITPEAVQGAASAAEIMANMANKLPAQDGLVQKIFGEKSLSDFGQELVEFGPNIVEFANQVSKVTPEAVQGAASAAEIMAKLANTLPDGETLWNKIFGGGQVTLSEFGQELVLFGKSMTNFSNSVSGIDIEKINNAIASFKKLVDLTNYVKDKSATDLINFSNQLGQIGTDSVDKFVQAFNDGSSKAANAVSNFFSAVKSALNSGGSDVKSTSISIGNDLALGLQSGITQNQSKVISTITSLAQSMTNQMKSSLPSSTFINVGHDIPISMSNGIYSGQGGVVNAAISIARSVIDAIQNNLTYNTFYIIGGNTGNGLADGIYSRINHIANAAITAATSAITAAKNALGVHSPSRVFQSIGKYVSMGLSEGILNNVKEVSSAGQTVADAAIHSARDALAQISDAIENSDPKYQPTIVPVIDLENVSDAANQVYSTFKGLDLSTTMGLAHSVSYEFSKEKSKSEPKESYDKKVERKLDQLIKKDEDNPKVENINTFYIQSTDPKQAAEEVGYIMQHKVERGKAAWAR